MQQWYTVTMIGNILFIAEVKTVSPFGFKSPHSWEDLFKIANKVGDIISIHTDPRWGGSPELLKKARKMTKKPILAKGIHKNDQEISDFLKIGADFVLVVGRIPDFAKKKLLIEPNTIQELAQIPPEYKAVWNSRDLTTGGMKAVTFEEARAAFSGWLCQASNIRTENDVNMSADAILIGANLAYFSDL